MEVDTCHPWRLSTTTILSLPQRGNRSLNSSTASDNSTLHVGRRTLRGPRLSVPCATGKGSTAAGPVPAQLQNRIALAASAFANSLPSAFAPELRESGLLVSSWQADRMVWVDLLPAWKGPPWIDSPKGWSLSFLLTTSHLSHIYLNEFSDRRGVRGDRYGAGHNE